MTEQNETRPEALALSEVNINLTRALEALEEVPTSSAAFAHPENRLRLQELIARAGGIVASAQAHGGFTLGPCEMPSYSGEEGWGAKPHRATICALEGRRPILFYLQAALFSVYELWPRTQATKCYSLGCSDRSRVSRGAARWCTCTQHRPVRRRVHVVGTCRRRAGRG